MICWYPDMAEKILKDLYAQIRPSLMLFIEAAGYLPDWDVILMQTAYCLEPESLSPLPFIISVPYTRSDFFLERMLAAAGRGWLCDEESGNFRLTDSGREVIEGIYELCDRLYMKIQTLTDQEIAQIIDITDRLIADIKELDEPDQKPAFELSLIFIRDKSRPPIVQLRQRLFALLAFGKDAHMAAWRPFEKDGQVWECFSLIWQNQAGSAVEIADKLSHRSFTRSDYAAAIEKLNLRGWIVDQDGRWIARPQAAQMCQEIKDRSDRTFRNAFIGLSLADKVAFRKLMEKLAFKIQQSSSVKLGVDSGNNSSATCKAMNA